MVTQVAAQEQSGKGIVKVIALTSVPPRFEALCETLKSLLSQSSPADAVELYIPRTYHRFPDYDGSLPSVPEGVTLVRTDHDFGPLTKVHYALQRHQKASQILFCDDDMAYPSEWAGALFEAQAVRPDVVVAADGDQLPGLKVRQSCPMPRGRRGAGLTRLFLAGQSGLPGFALPFHVPIARSGYVDVLAFKMGVVFPPVTLVDKAVVRDPKYWEEADLAASALLAHEGLDIWAERGVPVPRETRAASIAREFIGDDRRRVRLHRYWDAMLQLRAKLHVWNGGREEPPGEPLGDEDQPD